ncbi:MAG: hypothetical protein GX591_18135 [Planctomycetes bacterium]|nr:hypothetical protein [Planctomycetota bacterium]
MIDRDRILAMLTRWAEAAEAHWCPVEDGRLGVYGTGYNGWGVQTNQKYLAAMALLGARGDEHARARALAALRYNLATHVSGGRARMDGSRWGHTWISALGIERMMFGVYLLEPFMADDDRRAVDRVLASEADWLLTHYDVAANLWNVMGGNKPESNLWNGCISWRAAEHCPDHPHAGAWREKARCFLINAVSVPADIGVEPRNVGAANFFPNYALDHHGYMNVGYMVICTSNAAMLHFDLKARGFSRPAELDHHEVELWETIRRMIFADGRLARLGGDSRVRYAYCQDYLLPAVLYAADALGDGHAGQLATGVVELMAREYDHNGDGTFFSRRLAGSTGGASPLYSTRLESDRACVLAMAVRYAELMDDAARVASSESDYETSVAGGWCEPLYGAVMHRCPTRLASFVWPACDVRQNVSMGLCTPPGDGHLVEWVRNLAGRVEFVNTPYDGVMTNSVPAAVVRRWIGTFDGGFATIGEIIEGTKVEQAEGWKGEDLARQRLAYVALPDGHTVVGLQRCAAGGRRFYLTEVQGLRLNVANDLFNDFQRTLATEAGRTVVTTPAPRDELIDLHSRWVNVDDRLGAIGLYGAETMHLRRTPRRCAGRYESLHVEQFAWSARLGAHDVMGGAVLFDVGWLAVSALDAAATAELAAANRHAALADLPAGLRGVRVRAADGAEYAVIANFGDTPEPVDVPSGFAPLLASCGPALPSMAVGVWVKG